MCSIIVSFADARPSTHIVDNIEVVAETMDDVIANDNRDVDSSDDTRMRKLNMTHFSLAIFAKQTVRMLCHLIIMKIRTISRCVGYRTRAFANL